MTTENTKKSWFDFNPSWDRLLEDLKPQKILEIGCFKGETTCYLLQKLSGQGNIEIDCVDPWEDYTEPGGQNMKDIEKQFDTNLKAALQNYPAKVQKYKAKSDFVLPDLLASRSKKYDLIYVDGSHFGADVLFDAVMAFKLCNVGGTIIFDDYLWAVVFDYQNGTHGVNLSMSPKIAIDTFTTLYWDKLKIIPAPLYQIVVRKISD